MEKIKPCPFCGGKAILKKIPNTDLTPYYVRCNSKECPMYVATCNRDTPEEAIAIWNRREGGQEQNHESTI